jgi:MoaA/NifB/PqqE/SkfB family radical SAM enzyme
MTFDVFRKLEPLFPRVVKCLLFGNGEPLMNPDFPRMLARLKDHGIVVSFNSNGLLVTEEIARFFVERGIDNVTFSIDGATAATYEAIRVGSDFARVTANVRRLIELRRADPERKGRPYVILACVLMSLNLEEAPAMVDLCVELGADKLHFEPLLRLDNPTYEERVYANLRLSNLPPDTVAARFEETTRRARGAALPVVGPYVDAGGRLSVDRMRAIHASERGERS